MNPIQDLADFVEMLLFILASLLVMAIIAPLILFFVLLEAGGRIV